MTHLYLPMVTKYVTFNQALQSVEKISNATIDIELYKNVAWLQTPAEKIFTKKCLGKNQICISLSRRIIKWELLGRILTFLGGNFNSFQRQIF